MSHVRVTLIGQSSYTTKWRRAEGGIPFDAFGEEARYWMHLAGAEIATVETLPDDEPKKVAPEPPKVQPAPTKPKVATSIPKPGSNSASEQDQAFDTGVDKP
jgi:hypothetical protein